MRPGSTPTRPGDQPWLRILHLEDDPYDADLVRAALAAEGIDCDIRLVDNRDRFLREIDEGRFDLILADHGIPGFDGSAALTLVRERWPEVPFIFVTGSLGEETAIETFKHGATDYVLKERLARLAPAVRRGLREAAERIGRHQAEVALRQSEERFRAFMDHAQVIAFIKDASGQYVYLNKHAEAFLDVKAPQAVGKTDFDLFPADAARYLRENDARVLDTGQPLELVQPLPTADGQFRYLLSSKFLIRDLSGRRLLGGVAIDITERRRAEEQLRQSQKELAEAQAIANLGSWSQDRMTRLVNWSDEVFRILGLAPGQVSPTFEAFQARVHPEDRQLVRDNIAKVLREGKSPAIDFRIVRPDGEIRLAHGRAKTAFDLAGQPVRLFGTLQDITERRQAEDRIREQAALLEHAHDAILVHDLDQRITFWNHGATHLYGWNAAEVLGKNADTLLYPGQPTPAGEAIESVITRSEWSGELYHTTKAGSQVVVQSRWTLMRDETGRPKSILVINNDITEKKQLEAQFLRAQRLENLGTLAGGIAHDLNNVLAPILMGVQVLRLEQQPDATQKILDILESGAQRGASMVRQILSFARGVEGERTELRLNHLIVEQARIMRDTFPRSIEIRTRVPRDLWSVVADATQLHQVLMNLCVNARDAMPEGGTLRLEAENLAVDEVYARQHPGAEPGPYIMLEVQDTGAGIPPGIIDKIFDPFFTTKEVGKGTGLGLSTVLGIVKSHAGFVEVQSNVGRGTTFRVCLPAAKTPDTIRAVTARPDAPPGHGECLLVVDDEATIREITKRTLETYGYRVLTANDGTEALAIYANRKDEIHLVVTDMMMPFMNGPATIRTLHRLNPAVKIIAVSGLFDNVDPAELRQTGVVQFLQKPFTTQQLLQVLQAALHPELQPPPS